MDLSLLKNQKPPLKTLKCSWGNQSFSSRFYEYKLNSLSQTYKQILLHILYCIQNQFKTHLASETKTVASNWAFSFFLNHQLPCFALEVLGRLQWRRVFFGSQVNVFVSFSLRPKLIPLSVNQWNRPHAFGLHRCSCTPLVRIKLPFSGSVRTVPSPWQTQGHVSLTDDIGQRWGSL